MRQALEAEGHQVFETDSVKRGLIEAATRKPHPVDPRSGAARWRRCGPGARLARLERLPVIVLSARTGEPDKIEALDAGADDCLVKPFSVGDLQARVGRFSSPLWRG